MLAYGTDLSGLDCLCKNTQLVEYPAILENARAVLKKAQEGQVSAYNSRRKEVKIETGDLAILRREGLQTGDTGLSRKYAAPFLGPFKVLEVYDQDNF